MKTLLIFLLAASVFSTACSNNNDNSKERSVKNNDTASKATVTDNNESKKTGTVDDIVSAYLNLKNALTSDKGKDAAAAANEIGAALAKVDESILPADQKKIYDDVKDDIKEHAEHIGSNGSDIEHQREHFDLLSKDMIDLVKVTGSSQTLYKDFCPMYNNKKGASWLSETKEIKNPYYGNKMPKCGQVKEEIKAKG
ncbi:MAG TPA: DUF3347 domain-containing protein [Chitinophagaceae bacterium]|nr:DUF3347 domain-containing protein [Chitinophagaceae bacterium]